MRGVHFFGCNGVMRRNSGFSLASSIALIASSTAAVFFFLQSSEKSRSFRQDLVAAGRQVGRTRRRGRKRADEHQPERAGEKRKKHKRCTGARENRRYGHAVSSVATTRGPPRSPLQPAPPTHADQ
jgi:hypothetical protein